MSVVYILVPLALIVGSGFVVAFVWALRRGQFDDMDTPAVRMLFDGDGLRRGAEKPAAPTSRTDESDGKSGDLDLVE